ncbi:MAG: SH3 domain-containing protein [Victivallales bacterium]
MKNIILIISFFSAFTVLCADQIVGTVKANVLNIRVKPGEKYAVVAQLSRNDKVDVLGFEKGWYEITAPKKSSVWISSAFVKDGIVSKKAYVRTGPSVACAPYMKFAEEGTKIEILDTTQEGWMRISVFGGLTAWANADFVEVDPVQAGTLKGDRQDEAVPPEDKGKNDKGEDKKNSEPAKMSFTGIGPKSVSYEGVLVPVQQDMGTGLVTHAIAARTEDQYFPICYIYSRKMNMKLWEDKKIQVTGQERWVRDWHKPVVEVDLVNALW